MEKRMKRQSKKTVSPTVAKKLIPPQLLAKLKAAYAKRKPAPELVHFLGQDELLDCVQRLFAALKKVSRESGLHLNELLPIMLEWLPVNVQAELERRGQ
jgi:hypothetical protein